MLFVLSFGFIFLDVICQDSSTKFQQLHGFLTSILSQLQETMPKKKDNEDTYLFFFFFSFAKSFQDAIKATES